MKTFNLFSLLVLLAGLSLVSCQNDERQSSTDYFGQEIPVETAEVFAPGIISLPDRWEGNANFSPDGTEFYFNVFTDSMKDKAIYQSRYEAGKWTKAQKLISLGNYNHWEPFISYSGNELFFVSSRPPGNEVWNGRIWKSQRGDDNQWKAPELINIKVDTENGLWFPNHSKTDPNILYHGGNLKAPGTVGKGDLYRYHINRDSLVHLRELSSEAEDWDPFIAPDGSYLLWASDRPGGYGGTDLYVSFKTDDQWGAPVNLGAQVNTGQYEVAPRISKDGKVLFFDRPGKGTQDIYWISSKIIQDLSK